LQSALGTQTVSSDGFTT